MKKLWLLGVGAVLAAGVAGCRPELAQSPLTPKEEQWESFIQEEYPSWKSPRTYPPTVRTEEAYTPEETLRLESGKTARPEALQPPDLSSVDAPGAPEEVLLIDAGFEAEEVAPPVEEVIYKVAKNDTLSAIALKFYGNARLFSRILEANPALNGNPNRIRVGQELVIPNPTRQP